MNQPGPHQRIIDRVIRAAEKMGWKPDGYPHRAATGTVYIELWREATERSVTIRFAAHGDAYGEADYCVAASPAAVAVWKAAGAYEGCGYDGDATACIAWLADMLKAVEA